MKDLLKGSTAGGIATLWRASRLSLCVVLLAACGSPAPSAPPNAPTVAAAATQLSAIRSGAATPGSTAQALATQLAPTIQVIQATVGPIATSVAKSTVHITAMTVTPDDTTVVVQNSGTAPVDLQGWTLFFGPNIPLTLPSITLAPGQSRTLHVAAGTTTDSDVYLAVPSVGAIATTFAPGQRAVLVQPDDQVASVLARN
jgi:hypothetical protein